jgi:hypothetical protein
MEGVMTFVEWFRDLAPDQAFLFSLPFLVVAVVLMSDWLRQRHGRRSKTPH